MTWHEHQRPRVLVLAPRLPSPPIGGVDLRVVQTVSGLARSGDPALFVLDGTSGVPPAGVGVWRAPSAPMAEDPRTAAGMALEWLREPGGHPYDRYFSESAARDLQTLIADFRPDAAVMETLPMCGYLDVLSHAGVPLVLSAHNVEGPLQRDLLGSIGQGLPPPLARKLAEGLERLEAHAFSAVDQIWACSERDAELIRATYPDAAEIRVVPNTIDVASYESARKSGRKGHSVLYPGLFSYPPNLAAASWLARELMPLLQESFADATLVLAGGEPAREMIELAAAGRGIRVTGPMPDMRPQLAAAGAMAVPLFQGGGTRFKVLEAFAAQLPVVSTPKGVEGLDVQAGQHFVEAGTPRAFADAVGELWADAEERARIVDAALELVQERYSWRSATREMEAAVAELLG